MKTKLITLLMILLLVIATAGCSSTNVVEQPSTQMPSANPAPMPHPTPIPPPMPHPTPMPPPNENQGSNIPFEILDKAPDNIILSNERGLSWYELDDSYLVVICLGEKQNTGYGIQVESVKDIGDKTEIVINETEPHPGLNDMVIVYPRAIIKIGKNIVPNFEVRNW